MLKINWYKLRTSDVHNLKYLTSSVFPVYSKTQCVLQVLERRVIELKTIRYISGLILSITRNFFLKKRWNFTKQLKLL